MEENNPGFVFNKKTILSVTGVVALLIATGIGVYLAQQKQLFKPKAYETKPVSAPETSLSLSAPSSVAPGSDFRVFVLVRSDIDAANLFASKLKFPTEYLQVKSINTGETANNFIKNWVENTYNNQSGTISVVGGVPAPGFRTAVGQLPGQVMEIDFTAKKEGVATISFDNDSAIYRNSDNENILTTRREVSLKIQIQPSITPGPKGFGKAIKLNNEGTGNAYVVVKPINLTTVAPTEWTLETWVKTPKPTSGNYVRDYTLAAYTKQQSSHDYGYLFRLSLETQDSDGSSRPMMQALIANSYNTVNSNYATVGGNGSKTLAADTWNHLAVTGSAWGDLCTLKLYVNGVLSDSSEKYSQGCHFSAQQAQEVWIGRPPVGLGGASGYYYPGAIDEIRFSTALRYTSNFTPPTSPFVPENNGMTAALYHFDNSVNDSGYYRHNTQPVGNVQFIDSTIGQPSSTPTPIACGDLALKKPVKASGYWEDGNPEKVVDGDLGTSWRTSESTGAWWYVDLGSVQTIDTVKLSWGWDDRFGASATSKISVGLDGKNWTGVAQSVRTKSNNARKVETLQFSPVQARYVRFYATQWNGGWADMQTFEAYGSGCQGNVTPTPAGIPGDVNRDNKITLVDMSGLLSRWGMKAPEAGSADLNNDGVVNSIDYSMMINILVKAGVIKGASDLPSNLQQPNT